ncbi:MAG: colicin V production protein [Rhodospirillaceae bacterium]|nr:colicin V production protein [Rhodospirillaceae bacterium]|tara:strand:- start:893 stop:1579 length:687 start_codon:yes stop_codon:yes gene_type:complete
MTFDIAALNIIDFAALIILVISGILATLRGMTREIMGLAGWPVSILVARICAPYLAPVLEDLLQIKGLSDILGWVIPFVAAVILWFVFSNLVSPGLSKAGLGSLDRWLGFLFGVLRGYVILLVVYAGAVVVAKGETNFANIVTDAEITPALRDSWHLFAGVLPGDMREMLIENLPPPAKEVEAIQDTVEEVGETIADRTDSSDADTTDTNTDTGAGPSLDLRSEKSGN